MVRIEVRNHKKEYVLFLFSISIFITDSFYLNAEWYGGDIVHTFLSVFAYGCVILLTINEVYIQGRSFFVLSIYEITILILVLFAKTYPFIFGTDNKTSLVLGDFKTIILLFALVKMNEDKRASIFVMMYKIFAIIVLPGLIYYIITNLGLANLIPHSLVSRHGSEILRDNQYYYVFPFGVVLHSNSVFRFCGVFDEPGVIGTISAFFYIAGYKRISTKWERLLLLEGALSLSTAFYLMITMFFIIQNFKKRRYRIALILFLLFISYYAISSIDTSNMFIRILQEKMNFSTLLTRRETTSFRNAFDEFINNRDYTFWFGHGTESHLAISGGSFSYKLLIWDYGIIGTIIYIGVFLYGQFRWGNKETLPFFICFMASIFQRPFVLGQIFVALFFGGLSFISLNNGDEDNSMNVNYPTQC